ncbi:diaminopimelate epimerase [Ichthyobacterium seriolicida]|uniref:Diaminopimelate epimerase n=1 Tax=Ichthyobacterium seriolicida TaxID=242600 RepID=A0A1J1DXF9_9FLAO|nr:diaminopimelate epimerase [Ichthyobacterium seriolicida]BAV94513.1 diaminopimelate epimerase [Ichthyobacterium seriolicida]
MQLYKYQATGNDFIIIDDRNDEFIRDKVNILCDRRFGIGADGLILLKKSYSYDFKMIYYNSDGKESSMCGNGGSCIVAFAKKIGLINNTSTFEAIDGVHSSEILGEQVKLKMCDVYEIISHEDHFFLDTGSPHYIKRVDDVKVIDVVKKGAEIRYGKQYSKHGVNVNFLELKNSGELFIRTYERGVENETLGCGTGAVAAAIVSRKMNWIKAQEILVNTLGGSLRVSFENERDTFKNIYLTAKPTFIFETSID